MLNLHVNLRVLPRLRPAPRRPTLAIVQDTATYSRHASARPSSFACAETCLFESCLGSPVLIALCLAAVPLWSDLRPRVPLLSSSFGHLRGPHPCTSEIVGEQGACLHGSLVLGRGGGRIQGVRIEGLAGPAVWVAGGTWDLNACQLLVHRSSQTALLCSSSSQVLVRSCRLGGSGRSNPALDLRATLPWLKLALRPAKIVDKACTDGCLVTRIACHFPQVLWRQRQWVSSRHTACTRRQVLVQAKAEDARV